MKLTRTSNAGILLEIDGVTVLLDGVCGEVTPYIATPPHIKTALMHKLPNIVAFTHLHADHYDEGFANAYITQSHRPVLYGSVDNQFLEYNNVRLMSVPTRHIGKSNTAHSSYAVCAERCVWFMGDASPACLSSMQGFPKPYVLAVPFAYALTESSWQKTRATGARYIVLLHLPHPQNDSLGLWDTVKSVTQNDCSLYIPQIDETLTF